MKHISKFGNYISCRINIELPPYELATKAMPAIADVQRLVVHRSARRQANEERLMRNSGLILLL